MWTDRERRQAGPLAPTLFLRTKESADMTNIELSASPSDIDPPWDWWF